MGKFGLIYTGYRWISAVGYPFVLEEIYFTGICEFSSREALNIQVYVSDFPLYLLIYKQFPGYFLKYTGMGMK